MLVFTTQYAAYIAAEVEANAPETCGRADGRTTPDMSGDGRRGKRPSAEHQACPDSPEGRLECRRTSLDRQRHQRGPGCHDRDGGPRSQGHGYRRPGGRSVSLPRPATGVSVQVGRSPGSPSAGFGPERAPGGAHPMEPAVAGQPHGGVEVRGHAVVPDRAERLEKKTCSPGAACAGVSRRGRTPSS